MKQQANLDELLALYEQLEGEAAQQQAERRRHARTAAKGVVPAVLVVAGQGVPTAVIVRDMSQSGVGVYAPNPVRVGERAEVAFRLATRGMRAVCRVANCREEAGGTGRWIVGMAFVEVRREEVAGPAAGADPAARAGEMGGEVQSSREAMQGAELGHVDQVVRRLSRVLRAS